MAITREQILAEVDELLLDMERRLTETEAMLQPVAAIWNGQYPADRAWKLLELLPPSEQPQGWWQRINSLADRYQRLKSSF